MYENEESIWIDFKGSLLNEALTPEPKDEILSKYKIK